MAKIESKIGTVPKSGEHIYGFISNFNNFSNFVPGDKVQDFNSTEDTCSFSVPGLGKAGLKIIEKEPFKLIKISSDEQTAIKFSLWIQIQEVNEGDSRLKITIEPDLNPMMMMMAKSPLKNFVDGLIDQMEQFHY